ncbi:retrovirus-related pol polyprotein from transposon TNT 1-94 [Tanacetum coccineum]
MKKVYCLVVTDDYSRFSWVLFLATKDETSEILKTFITGIENLIDLKVKVIRCDNGTEFKNKNGVAERINRTLIKAARIMLADSKLSTTFWAEAVNTACYVQNRVLVIKPHNKTPYELFLGRKPALSFMRPFGCPITILNTIDHLDATNKYYEHKPVVSKGNQSKEEEKKDAEAPGNEDSEVPSTEELRVNKEKYNNVSSTNNVNTTRVNSTNTINTVRQTVNAAGIEVNVVDPKSSIELPDDLNIPELEDNCDIHMMIITPQTRRMTKNMTEHAMSSSVQQKTNHKDKIACLHVSYHKKSPRRNKKDERDIVIKNKVRLVSYGYTQEEGIDYDEIEEEVYVCQPPGFEDPNFTDKVYKVEKALYGLHQAPRAWYETLSTHLLDNGFHRGKIDKTLFIRRDKGDILLVQVYADDIIFGSTKKSLCTEFERMMHKKFQMSSMGELIFFLGLQVKQKEDGIFISQDKYVTKILRKFGFSDVKTASIPMETHKPLLKDTDGEDVDKHLYRSMIRSLMYLTSSRLDIMFADSPFDLVADNNSDYAGASLERKYIIGGCQFLGCRLVSWQCKKQIVVANFTTEAEYIAASNYCRQLRKKWVKVQLILLIPITHLLLSAINISTPKKQKPRKSKRKDTKIPQSSGPTEPIADEAANEENVPTHSNDPLLSGEDSLKLNELMELSTTLQKKEDASKQGRKILDINADEDITLDSTHFDTNPDMFGVHDLYGDELFVETEEPVVNAAITTTTTATTTVADEVEITLAQTLIEIKSAKPKAKGIVMQEPKGTEREESSKRVKTIGQESSSKRAGDELEQEKAKKQKIDDDQEEAKMKELMKVISDEEGVAIDAIPLSC